MDRDCSVNYHRKTKSSIVSLLKTPLNFKNTKRYRSFSPNPGIKKTEIVLNAQIKEKKRI